ALLMLPMVGFVDATNEVMMNTIEAIESDLLHEGFVLRYLSNDGIPGDEGTFLLCTCWLVDNLAMIGRRDDALGYFERVLDVANDVGLLAEEYDSRAKRLVGNFPQGFSHIAVITAAMAFETQGRTPILHRHETNI
ncbi:MAG: glycoside hydrolase family 15 protein, partial [Actinomycetota bacterium]